MLFRPGLEPANSGSADRCSFNWTELTRRRSRLMNFFLYRLLLGCSPTTLIPRQLSTSRVSMAWHSRHFLIAGNFIQLFFCIFDTIWENSRHFATPPLVSFRNDVCETSAEIPYWWRVTTEIWVVHFLLSYLVAREICFYQSGYRIQWRKQNGTIYLPFLFFFHRLHSWILRMRQW